MNKTNFVAKNKTNKNLLDFKTGYPLKKQNYNYFY